MLCAVYAAFLPFFEMAAAFASCPCDALHVRLYHHGLCVRPTARLQEVSPGLGLQPEPDITDESAPDSAPSQGSTTLNM